jgi:sulfur-oxidizing protein SoxA
MRGVAARYPRADERSGALLNLEARINLCRSQKQGARPLAYESEDLLALVALVALQSRGVPASPRIDGKAAAHFEKGRALFFERQGQLNLACAQCHEGLVGKRLRGDVISSGLGLGFPAYRHEWQALGSLHRRFSACFSAIRAERFAPGSPEYLALELYLAWRGRGQPLEAPAVRR